MEFVTEKVLNVFTNAALERDLYDACMSGNALFINELIHKEPQLLNKVLGIHSVIFIPIDSSSFSLGTWFSRSQGSSPSNNE